MEKHYQKMLRDTEDRVVKSLQIQVLDRESPRYGGFADPTGIVQAKFAIYRIAGMAAAYCNEDTCFYRDGRVYDSILKGLDYVTGVQHESGLFDYITCNFFSAPDTAFCIKKLLPLYQYLKGRRDREAEPELTEEENCILGKVEQIVRQGAYGLLQGGFHTPNHRWAIASLLMSCSRLFDCKEMETAAFT